MCKDQTTISSTAPNISNRQHLTNTLKASTRNTQIILYGTNHKSDLDNSCDRDKIDTNGCHSHSGEPPDQLSVPQDHCLSSTLQMLHKKYLCADLPTGNKNEKYMHTRAVKQLEIKANTVQ